MKTFKGFLYGVAIAIAVSAGAATVYNYFPPPGMTYSPTAGLTVGTPTGGSQGTGTINAQGLFVNGASLAAAAGSNTQVQYNNSGAFGASSLFTFTPGSVVLNLGAATTPGTFSVGALDSMVVNGVTVPVPSFAANSNIQGVIENHSYVNGVSSGGARYYGVRSEGTISSPTIVANGDHLSTFYAAGYNGSSYSLGGSIIFSVDGTPGASAMPTDVDFALSPAGSQTPASVLKLFNTGAVAINSTTPSIITNTVSATSNGIALSMTAGSGGATSGNSGALTLSGGVGTSNSTVTSGNGGNLVLSAGRAVLNTSTVVPSGNGGSVTLSAGIGAGTVSGVTNPVGDGGSVTITAAGPDLANGGQGNGGNVSITAGSAFGPVTPKTSGNITITAGGAGSVGTDTPGNVTISAGTTATIGTTTVKAGQAQLLLHQGGSPEWSLGNSSSTGNRLTGTAAGGIQIGAPSGGDQGVGTLNMQGCFVNGVACSTGGAAGANPTGTVGLTAVNGVAGTYMRSDAAPPLSQAIAPTWTGGHIFSASSAVAITINANGSTNSFVVAGIAGRSALAEFAANGNTAGTTSMAIGQDSGGSNHILGRNAASLLIGTNGTNWITLSSTGTTTLAPPTSGITLSATAVAGSYAALFQAPNSAGNSFGVDIDAGTNSTDRALQVRNAPASSIYFSVFGDGSVTTGSAAAQGAGTFNSAGQIYQAGQPIYREVSWAGTCTAGGCTTGISKGTGTVTRNSAGNYTVAISSAFGGNAGCTASPWSTLNNGAISAEVSTANTTSVNVVVLNTSGTAVDSGFTVICIG